MAEEKTKALEREYVVPLRREFLKVSRYRRAGRAAKTIKKFIAKHMKVEDRDVDKVKLDPYINNEIWFRGKTNPPSRIKVRARKEDGIVKVEFVEVPEHVKFIKKKHEKFHKEAETKPEKKEQKPAEAKPAEKPAEVKKEEKKAEAEIEKEKSIEEVQIKEARKEKLASKHVTKVKGTEIKRKALNRH